MNSAYTPTPNACLIAILLITRDSSGDKLTFHYPPKPTVDTPLPSTSTYTASSASSSAASDVASSGDEDDDRQSLTTTYDLTAVERSESGSRIGRRRSRKAVVEEAPEEEETTKDDGGPPWETVLGFKADFLAGLLAPKACMCKRKFELTVDDVVFLGFPLHVRPDGTWRKKKKRRGRGTEEEEELEEKMDEATIVDRGSDAEEEEKEEEEEQVEAVGEAQAEVDPTVTTTVINGNNGIEEEKDGDDEGSITHGGGMSMFHVVFVLNPPEMEYHIRTKEIFDCVVKRFARALKYEQAKDGYVWREAVKINRLRDKAVQEGTTFSELWRQILDQSSLAYAISRIFTDISQNKIAHIFLNNSLGLSLQIPITTETSVLPSITDPQVPGLPLTTADSFGDDENEGDNLLVRHFTLLFLVDVDSILKDIAAEPSSDSSNSLAHFVKSCKPSMSFLQISNSTGIPLHDIQLMARHLIHWRKARAIPPIHHRDIYIVSPNADMKGLHTLIPVYAKLFPTLPALPKILSRLSQKPKPYSALIPSRDHRAAYCEILAWLLRHGLVTQLRMFAWIRVTRDIKVKVFREQQQLQQQQQSALMSRSMSRSRSPSPSRADIVASAAFVYPEDPHPEDPEFEESIVLAPHQASAQESTWLEMMTRGQPPDVRALWDRLLKYLNGQHAIEKISVREGISRRDVRRVLGVFDEYIIYARHW